MVCDNSVSSGQYERMNHIWSFINYSKSVHLILDMMSRMLRATASFFLGLTGAVAKQNLREKREREKVRAFLICYDQEGRTKKRGKQPQCMLQDSLHMYSIFHPVTSLGNIDIHSI